MYEVLLLQTPESFPEKSITFLTPQTTFAAVIIFMHSSWMNISFVECIPMKLSNMNIYSNQ